VTQHLCPRCRTVLSLPDESSLVFCTYCGAPQVQISEELREQANRQTSAPPGRPLASGSAYGNEDDSEGASRAEPQAGHNPVSDPASDSSSPLWAGALRLAALAGALAAALGLLTLVVEPVALLSAFWIVGAPIVVLGIYAARFPRTRITSGFGARLGLLTGLAIALATTLLNTAQMLVTRFLLRKPAAIDGPVAAAFHQMQTQMQSQLHAQLAGVAPAGDQAAASVAAVNDFLALFTIPEFRVGLLLATGLLFLCGYLLFSSIGGAFAGFLRSRGRPSA